MAYACRQLPFKYSLVLVELCLGVEAVCAAQAIAPSIGIAFTQGHRS